MIEDEFKKEKIDILYKQNYLPDNYPQLYPKQGFINDISALDFILNNKIEWLNYYNNALERAVTLNQKDKYNQDTPLIMRASISSE